MEQERAATLLSENLKAIFAFSFSRLCSREEAEDLTNDIICEVLQSVHRLRNDRAFYGFLWKIADFTWKKRLRQKRLWSNPSDERAVGVYWITPESECIAKEELRILRRELSLLSKQHRDVTVAYYLQGRACSDIAKEFGLSVEMVKYYLFKTRKILKEGFDMTRALGEKSYHPAVFRMDFWGDDGNGYWELFKRKLPGNLVLAAYEKPRTLQELSLELGVSAVYLEDELEILLSHGILCKTKDKYQTAIVIFTSDYDNTVTPQLLPLGTAAAEQLAQELPHCLPELRTLEFHGKNYNENRLKWTFANLALTSALSMTDREGRKRFGEYPPLSNGGRGFVFGFDNDYEHHHFNGIYGHCANKADTAYFSVENYRIIKSCQVWYPLHWEQSMEAMCDAILEKPADLGNEMLVRCIDEGFVCCNDGTLSANFPVFSADTLRRVQEILSPCVEMISRTMMEICEEAAKRLREFTPCALHGLCGQLCWIRYSMDTMAWIAEALVQSGYLTLPDHKENLCIYGVKK